MAVILISLSAVNDSSVNVFNNTNRGTIGGIIFCGVFLLVIAILGLIGTFKHHQVLLFVVNFNKHAISNKKTNI
jgi:hypothetical protein